MTRFRVRYREQQLGPWWRSIDEAEQAAIELKLAQFDADYDVLVLAPDVEIDGEDDGEADPAAS